ncbi:MAG: ATP-binding protein [Candidatus Uhrbacteria bacterium]
MALKRVNSIAFDIILVAFLCVAVILPTTVFASVAMIRQLLRDDLVTQTKQTLDFNEQLLRSQLSYVRLSLESFARDPVFVAALSADAKPAAVGEARSGLRGAVPLVDSLENIVLQRADCTIVAADSDYAAADPRNFLQSDYCADVGFDEDVFVSGRYVSALTDRSVLTMAVPIRNEAGMKTGIVSATLDLESLGNQLKGLQQPGQFAVVLDRNNRVIIDTRTGGLTQGDGTLYDAVVGRAVEEAAKWSGTNGVFNIRVNDSEMVAAYDKYDEDPGKFTLIKVEPSSLANHVEQRIVLILSSAGAGMILALALALWITVRLSTRRLNQITDTIQHIAGGTEDERLPEELLSSGDEVGTLGRSFNVMIDRIHESQSLLQQAKAKSDAILLGIGDGVVAIGSDGKIILFNHAAERISDLTADESIGKPYGSVLRFVHEKDRVADDSFVRKALNGKLSVMPDGMSLIRPDGSLLPVADSSAPIVGADGSVVGAVIVFRDVTHEREVDRLKTEFVSVASHQLRTPLTAIRWYLEDLQSQEIGPLLPEQKASVDQAVESTARMINLVNDLLNVSRLETGRLAIEPKPTDIAGVLRDVVQENTGIAVAKGCALNLHLPTDPLPTISVDPVLIRQVAANLVSNAVKYTYPETGKPQVDVTLTKDGKHYYRVTVTDNGMGIGAEDKGRIFERFFRANNAVKKQAEGSGLGLYIAKLIIEESGGMISFDSDEGHGSTFWFLLPVAGSKGRGGGKSLTTNEK